MIAIDVETYQTLNKALILQQEHPFQPHSNNGNSPNNICYQTVRKSILKKAIRDHGPNGRVCEIGTDYQENQLQDLYLSTAFTRYHTDDLMKLSQLFIIRTDSKQQLQKKHLFKSIIESQGKQAIQGKQAVKSPSDHQNATANKNITLKLQDLIQKPYNIPMKKQNYFENIGGFDNFYKYNNDKCKLIPSKRYPILFISNLSLLLSLFLALHLNDHTMWIVQSGIAVIYLLTVYYNEVRVKIFSIKKIESLQTSLSNVDKFNGYFMFHIECFHYDQCQEGDKKIVTYRKSEKLVPQSSKDESFGILDLEKSAKFIDLYPKQQFYFDDKQQEMKFATFFNKFVEKNKKDTHQKYGFSFQIQELVDLRGFFCKESNHCIIILFIICGVMGLIFPFMIWFQCNIHRYQANIIKKHTLE